MSDLISRAEAIEAVAQQWLFEASVGNPYVNDDDIGEYRKLAEELFEDVPSADALLKQEIDFHRKVSRIEAEKVVDLEHKLAEAVQGEWMPCSERLPIPPMFCLVTTDGSHGDVIDIALYMSDGWHKASEVIAWMPLPTPYKGGAE